MTARLFKAFGAKLIGYSRSVSKEALELGLEYVSLEQLMEQSDIVSLHVPNNAATKGMIHADLIARMKKTALFINCARGPIVDNAALAKALEEGKIGRAPASTSTTWSRPSPRTIPCCTRPTPS